MAVTTKHIESLPLFIGLTNEELRQIVKNVHFTQLHRKKNTAICSEGEMASSLMFVSTGWLKIETWSDDRLYHIVERMQAPQVLEADKLFGMRCYYRSTYIAETVCEVLAISKDSLMMLLSQYLVVRINFLNMICHKTQRYERQPWQTQSDDLQKRITLFIKQHCRYPAGHKTLYIKMTQLAHELNVKRLEVSNALNAMEQAERIILKRGIIEIPALQLLQ